MASPDRRFQRHHQEKTMRHTLTAAFDARGNAEHALNKLLAAGYSRAEVTLISVAPAGQNNRESSESTQEEDGLYESTRNFFAQLLGTQSDDYSVSYPNVAAPKPHVLIVTTESEPEAARAAGLVDGLVSAESGHTQNRHIQSVADTVRPGYPSGTEPGVLQNRAHGKTHYFGTRNSDDASPLGASKPAIRRGWDETTLHVNEDSHYRSHWNAQYDAAALRNSRRASAGVTSRDVTQGFQYRIRHWTAVVAESKAAWASRHVGELPPWERFKDALLHGWGRISLGNDTIEAAHPVGNVGSAIGARSEDEISPAFRFGDKIHHSDQFWGCDWEDVETELRDAWNKQYGGRGFAAWKRNRVEVRHGWDQANFSNLQ
jgi:hypothetical protein